MSELLSSVQAGNQSLFLWLNNACTAVPDWLWASLTITGHTSMVFALLTPLLLVKRGQVVLTGLLLCAVLGGLVSAGLKESFQLPRPPAVLAADAFRLIGHKLELVSFPSGHTLTAFAMATLLISGLSLRGWQLAGLALGAVAVGLSRIAVGAHWPLDVVAGAGAGIVCAQLSLNAAKILHSKMLWPNKSAYYYCQIALLWVVSCSLLGAEMGYPQAKPWQWLVAVFGVIMSSYAAILQLKQSKRF